MSIITTFEAVPSRLFAIYSTLFDSENGDVKDRIEAWATPPSLRTSGEEGERPTNLFSAPLAEARRLGLVEEVEGKLRLTKESRAGGKKGEDSEPYFINYMRGTLFDPLRAAEAKQSGFMVALSWFLSCSPLIPMDFSKDVVNELRAVVGDKVSDFEIDTYSSWQNLIYWARYFGFATIIGHSKDTRRVIPDPLNAIETALTDIYADVDRQPIEQFIRSLAVIFPVFETGSVRQDFERMRLNQEPDNDKRLSITTSIALQRLADRQRLSLETIADAPGRILNFGSRERRVTHVSLSESA